MNHVLAVILAVICPLGGWIGDAVLFIVGFFKLRPASVSEEVIEITPAVIAEEEQPE
jgi:hypothetical protein